MATPRIALSAGHHNQDGGHATEIRLVGPVTKALAQACRQRGFDVRVITPDEGMGTHPGGLNAVASTVVQWAAAGWTADIFLEVHAEANGSGDAGRGCFAIYPDWGADVDTKVRDQLGPALANAIAAATKIPRRGNGTMSERKTGVGLGGNRLGVFRITQGLRTTTRRLLVEMGSYTSPADLKIMNGANFPTTIAGAMADALASYAGLTAQPEVQVIGVGPSITPAQFIGALEDHKAQLSREEMERIYRFCLWLQVDPAFLVALWKAEGGSPLGVSPLQQQTHQPINIKAAVDEWRPVVAYRGSRWLWSETFQLGCYAAVLHLKNVHGASGRVTVEQIIPVHARADDGNDVPRIISNIREDMRYMTTRPQ
jgi:N-acetylmuramoyl-L-alanine amidase